jgi:hypothetical protein
MDKIIERTLSAGILIMSLLLLVLAIILMFHE